MIAEVKPLAEVTQDAVRILYRELGVVDTVRFLMQFTKGYGNYTEERESLFAGQTLETLVAELKERRKQRRPRRPIKQ